MQKTGYLVLIVTSILALIIAFNAMPLVAQSEPLTPEEELGKLIFFDEMLSDPLGQSCATCHAPEAGFHRSRLDDQRDDRRLSWGCAHPIRQPQAANSSLWRRQPGAVFR